MKRIMLVAVLAIMMVFAPPISGAVITQDVEIRGEIFTGNATYGYANGAFFWYDLKKNISSETMAINLSGTDGRTIAKGDLVYQCTPKMVDYKSEELKNDPDLGKYKIIGFMAEKYIGYGNKTNKLVKLLIEWGSSKDTILTMNDPLEFPEGYALHAQEIDLQGGKCMLILYKDGKVLDEEIVVEGKAYKYFDDDDVLIFSAFIDTVFRGTDSNIVVVKYVFLRSEDILDVRTGDKFGVMKVVSTSASVGITLENKDIVTLDSDSKQDIMGGLYFKVADNSTTLRYYLAKTVSLVCPECPDCPEPEPCPEIMIPVATSPEIVEEIPTVIVIATPEPTTMPNDDTGSGSNTTPGFEAVFAVAGLLVVGYLVLKQRK